MNHKDEEIKKEIWAEIAQINKIRKQDQKGCSNKEESPMSSEDERKKRLRIELDAINELRKQNRAKGEESLTEFIKEKCEELKKEKKNIIVDLDGTLAYYDEWKGLDHIGDPLPGAQEFIEALKVKFDVIIFTTRTNPTVNNLPEDMQLQLGVKIVDWLSKHKFPQVEVYIGVGKPIGEYYLDDRAVVCAPQKDPDAYWKVLEAVR
jgi:hypothetical protein